MPVDPDEHDRPRRLVSADSPAVAFLDAAHLGADDLIAAICDAVGEFREVGGVLTVYSRLPDAESAVCRACEQLRLAYVTAVRHPDGATFTIHPR